jgi:hypothetical protein
MKPLVLLSLLILASVSGISQKMKPKTLILIPIKGTDSTMLINVIDLIGIWRNVSAAYPADGTIEIANGNRVMINDAWKEDYPNKLKNSTWRIVDERLEFRSPELGSVIVDVEKLANSRVYELTIYNFTYRQLINPSK